MPLVFSELTKHMILPRNITISVQGGKAGPYYNPRTRTIVLNHPFSALALNYWFKKYPKAKPYDIGYHFAELEYFVLFHEVGHALVDQWNIPVLGREEDAVDAFSTIFMTEIVKRGDFALAGAEFFLDLDKLTGAGRQAELRRRALVQQAARVLDRVLGLRERPGEVVADEPARRSCRRLAACAARMSTGS